MGQILADRRDIDFVLYEQINVEELAGHERFAEFNRKAVDLIVSEARNLALKQILPTQVEGDRVGARFEAGRVTTPPSFPKAWKALRDGGWLAMTEDPEWGGQGMPATVARAASEYLLGAGFAFLMYAGLTHGAGRLVETFGDAKQKALFLKKMYTGEWSGTMLLTEPGAGSDVGALSTTAVPLGDGTYRITGSKIFISSGEHDLTGNIIHPVLARIEGAPAGTAGISLFLVPRIWVNDDGSLGEPNDVVCTGIEEKLGIHGNPTCSIALGGRGQCRGTLLGEANKGMRAMFQMMNEARLMVGTQGLACASPSYLYALNYARTRVQGRHTLKIMDKNAPSVPIIQHPDVRRMLLEMKVQVEAMRSLFFYISKLLDLRAVSRDAAATKRNQGIIDFLIPIAKGYVTDRCFEVCSTGVQVYGGYGYMREYPVEQLLRDCRITQIYEGTNGIQAMDLLARKLGQDQGRPVMDLLEEIQASVDSAKGSARTAALADRVEEAALKAGAVARHMGTTAMYGNLMNAAAHAVPFLEICGDLVMAWMLLWRAQVAARAIEAGCRDKDTAFYEGQIKGAEFYVQVRLPAALGRMDAILGGCDAANEMPEDAFGGK